ncbi:MAG TPA: asparagine synthase (glutamine-hydrolyzing) [Thermoleophilaceae bacterium]|nr:asparagine synthase (glutamine-hydrolyzing) [Thermoleophilaceae bacterium]
MCGIAGVVDSERPVERDLVERMCAALEHRGPDSRGIHLEDGVGLGAQRLAIIDVPGGSQPVYNETGDVAVVFNGEIYNHHELRAELVRRGHRLVSSADTEVIAHLYEDHGPRLVERLRGMFAFAIWDARERRLVCARDRVGKKPLFYARRGGRFSFASELGALLQDETIPRDLDPEAIDAYLALQYVPHPLCALRGVRKLPPACTLVVEPGGSERVERYWELRYLPKRDAPPAELEQELRAKLDDAVRVRLESDVPLGALLSGGIDSSAVVASMAAASHGAVRTFSVGFDDPAYDESRFARLVSERFGTEHHELRLRPDALAIMPRLARHYGEPFGDSSALATFHLAELVAGEVTVALTGDGGDESFAGYDRYEPSARLERIVRTPAVLARPAGALLGMLGDGAGSRSARSRLARLGRLLALDEAGLYAQSVLIFDAAARRRLLAPGFGSHDAAERMLLGAWRSLAARDRTDHMMGVDVATYLPGDLLPKVDIATMAHSLEARSPLLDHELLELAASLPAGLKRNKGILRSALRGTLPAEVLDRPKMGFAVPLERWFREDLAGSAGELLLDRDARSLEFLDREAVAALIREHESRVADHSMRIWVLMMLETWQREVLSAAPAAV